MRAIKNKGTKGEMLLAKALWKAGCRYRKNDKSVYGKPDFSFKKKKVAIFVDSEFFHGKDWETEKFRIKSNRDFWWPKIERNMERDTEVNETLNLHGWKVIRFWSADIFKNLDSCLETILNALNKNEI